MNADPGAPAFPGGAGHQESHDLVELHAHVRIPHGKDGRAGWHGTGETRRAADGPRASRRKGLCIARWSRHPAGNENNGH